MSLLTDLIGKTKVKCLALDNELERELGLWLFELKVLVFFLRSSGGLFHGIKSRNHRHLLKYLKNGPSCGY